MERKEGEENEEENRGREVGGEGKKMEGIEGIRLMTKGRERGGKGGG